MIKDQVVVLFGDSLLMDAIEASLAPRQGLHVVRISTTIHNVEEYIPSLHPDIVIFDWDAPQKQVVLSLLRYRPGVPLLGIDITTSSVTALSSVPYPVLTVSALTDVLQRESPCLVEITCCHFQNSGIQNCISNFPAHLAVEIQAIGPWWQRQSPNATSHLSCRGYSPKDIS